MKKCKVKTGLLILAVLLIMGMCMLTGCKDDQITEIFIASTDMPRLEYVEGQDLELGLSRLTVIRGDEEGSVPLTDATVTISGYDKNVAGEQVVTIGYGGLTTTIKVTVFARAMAENYETKYFVGDDFKKDIGKIKITTDELKTISVDMKDSKVSLVSFDSSVAGKTNVTVRYQDGQNTYDCRFQVTVYEESDVQFTEPNKTKYDSSEAGVNVTGGFLTVTSVDSDLTKRIPLTADMISGFDLTAATMDNREEPLEQTLTVEYLGHQFTYNIYITFDQVSVVNHHAQNELLSIDWDGIKENGLTPEQGAAALDAINAYYKLTPAQIDMVSDENRDVVIRAGSFAACAMFYSELGKYGGTFSMDEQGNPFFVCTSYAQTVADLEKLNDSDEVINVYAEILRWIEANHGDVLLIEGLKVADYICVYSEEAQTSMMQMLNHLVNTYGMLADIPEDWTVESLKEYGADILSATMEIYNAGYHKNGQSGLYTNILSPWRTKNDFFDILYTYFLYHHADGKAFITGNMFGQVPLPGAMELWYQSLNTTLACQNYILGNSNGSTYLYDMTEYMFYYFQTLELAENIKQSGNPLWVDTYQTVNGDFLNEYYMDGMYHDLARAMIDTPAYHTLWKDYYTVVKLHVQGKLSATENKAEITKLFDDFENLSPTELRGFLSSLNIMYSEYNGEKLSLDFSGETVQNLLAVILRDYYMTYLNEANKPLFAKLLLAMEHYVLFDRKMGASDVFNTTMQEVIASYNTLSAADKANFDAYVGVSFEKYRNVYDLMSGNKTVQLTAEEQALFAELDQVLGGWFKTYIYIMQNYVNVGEELYAVLHVHYARAKEIYDEILATASKEAIESMYAVRFTLEGGYLMLAQAYYEADYASTTLLLRKTAQITLGDGTTTSVTGWDLFIGNYFGNGMVDILADMYGLLRDAYFSESPTVNHDYVVSLMATMRSHRALLNGSLALIGADIAYYRSLNTYFGSVLSETAKNTNVLEVMVNVETVYIAYTRDMTNAEARDTFIAQMEQFKAIYETLSAEDKAYISEMYNHYLGLYEQLKASPAAV